MLSEKLHKRRNGKYHEWEIEATNLKNIKTSRKCRKQEIVQFSLGNALFYIVSACQEKYLEDKYRAYTTNECMQRAS